MLDPGFNVLSLNESLFSLRCVICNYMYSWSNSRTVPFTSSKPESLNASTEQYRLKPTPKDGTYSMTLQFSQPLFTRSNGRTYLSLPQYQPKHGQCILQTSSPGVTR